MNERDLFLHALELPDHTARAEYLERVRPGDAASHQRIEALVRSWHMAAGFLKASVIEQLARCICDRSTA